MLVDLLDEATPRLIDGVAAALSPTATELGARRAIERLPEVMRGLVARLRAARIEEAAAPTEMPIQFEVEPLVTALRLLRQAIYALIDERQLPATPREMSIVGDWFATVAEAALTAENRRFSAMIDAIPDHLMLHSAEGHLMYVNRAGAEAAKFLAGLSREQLVGLRAIDLAHDKEFGQHIDGLFQRVRGGEAITEEFLLPSSDGGRWHQHHWGPIHGPDGKVEAIAVASRDIHERKKAEARLQLLSKLGTLADTMEYESILDAVARLSIPELADWCMVDIVESGQLRRGTIAHRDPGKGALARELLALPSQLHTLPVGKAALAGKSSLIHALDDATEANDLAVADLARRLGVRSAMVVPFVMMGAPVAVATFVTTRESGRRYRSDDLALAQEVARRAAQIIENAQLHQQLRQSEARFRVALEHANIAVFETDLELRLRWVYNPRLAVPESQLIGKTVSEILGAVAAPELDQLKRVLDTGAGARTDFSAIRDGKRRHFLAHYEPLRGIGGIVGLTGATVDVTELKEAEEQLAGELAFRERMMGVLGHDLRNPVSAVLGMAGLMRLEPGLSDKTIEGCGLIEQSARRMNEMIGTLLDFTRLRFHGSLPIAVEEIDLGEVASGMVAELQAAQRDREIESSTSGNLRGQWDPGRIAQLLSNLVANALVHGARKTPVRVAVAAEGDAVRLSVSNRGPTIPPELVERLFEPFQQGVDSGGNRPRGLGLGLYIVREIVRAHGGVIEVRSGDELTTFAVRLPRTAPSRTTGPSGSSPARGGPHAASQDSGPGGLATDDHIAGHR